jgi:hypothetical protein
MTRVTRVTRPLSLALRRGVTPWTFAVSLTALLCALSWHPSSYRQDWPSLAQNLRLMQLLLGPLVAAAACWQGGRERRRRTAELLASTPRPPLHRVATDVLAVWLAAAASYLVTWAVMVGYSWPYASGYGHPLLAPVFGDLAAVAMFTGVGYLLGWYVPWWSLAPLTAVGAYAVLGSGSDSPGGELARLSPASFDLRVFWAQAWWSGFAYAGWFGGLAVAALLLVGARRKWLVALPVAVAVCAAAQLEASAAEMWIPDRAAARLVCEGSRPQICMRRAHEGQRGDMTPAIRWAYARFGGVPTEPSRFEESEIPGTYATMDPGGDPDVSSFSIVTADDLGTDGRLDYFRRDAVLQDMLRWECESSEPGWTSGVLTWAHSGRGKVARALDTMSSQERDAWFTDYFRAARTCNASLVADPAR